jgi:hypothetical protein
VLGLLRLVAVDALHLEQRQVAFALLGGTDLPEHRVAGAQVEALDLAGGDVDVVRAVQVVPVLRAQEAVPLGKDLQHAFAAQDDLRVEQVLLDPVDQVLLAQPRVVGDVQTLRHLVQLSDGLGLKCRDVHELLRMALRNGGTDDPRAAGPVVVV